MSSVKIDELLDRATDVRQNRFTGYIAFKMLSLILQSDTNNNPEVVFNSLVAKVFERNEEKSKSALRLLDRLVDILLLREERSIGFCENLFQKLTTNVVSNGLRKEVLKMIQKWNVSYKNKHIEELVKQLTFVGFQLPQIQPGTVVYNVPSTSKGEGTAVDQKDNNRQVDETDLNSNIRDVVQCPVCFEVMNPPIYQCSVGHSICSKCKPQVGECPACRSPFGDVRNFTLETLLSELKFSCKFEQFGCVERILVAEVEKHEESCTFKTRPCQYKNFGCKKISFGAEMEKHEAVCNFKRFPCKFENFGCKELLQKPEIAIHQLFCGFKPLYCAYKHRGCKEMLPNKPIKEHEKGCRFRPQSPSYQTFGYKTTASGAVIEKHEEVCTFKPHSCKVKINGECAKVSELKKKYVDKVTKSNVFKTTINYSNDANGFSILKRLLLFNNFAFELSFIGNSKEYFWNVNHIHDFEEDFVYEIGIVDEKNPVRKLVQTEYCWKTMEHESSRKPISFPIAVLESFLNKGVLSFYCKIFKNSTE